MKTIKFKTLAIIAMSLFLYGCASELKKSNWVQVRNANVAFEQASADCEYDLHKMNRGGARLEAAMYGLQDPAYESCMKRYGFEWKKKVNELKNCDVGNLHSPNRETAMALGKEKMRFSFVKKIDTVSITIFSNSDIWRSADLIPTGRRFYSDGKPYSGYANKTSSLIVQEFEDSDIMIVTTRGDVDVSLYAKCH